MLATLPDAMEPRFAKAVRQQMPELGELALDKAQLDRVLAALRE